MNSLIISFKTRNSVYAFANILKLNRIFFKIGNTPKSISNSCGLSLKTELKNLNIIKNLISQYPNQILGIFLENAINGQFTYQRLL